MCGGLMMLFTQVGQHEVRALCEAPAHALACLPYMSERYANTSCVCVCVCVYGCECVIAVTLSLRAPSFLPQQAGLLSAGVRRSVTA